jgi:hypothetical protein
VWTFIFVELITSFTVITDIVNRLSTLEKNEKHKSSSNIKDEGKKRIKRCNDCYGCAHQKKCIPHTVSELLICNLKLLILVLFMQHSYAMHKIKKNELKKKEGGEEEEEEEKEKESPNPSLSHSPSHASNLEPSHPQLESISQPPLHPVTSRSSTPISSSSKTDTSENLVGRNKKRKKESFNDFEMTEQDIEGVYPTDHEARYLNLKRSILDKMVRVLIYRGR